jgi:hypothetical protein
MSVSATARPFHFMTQFWGTRYRDYFVDYCLPSLLASDNLPLLRAGDGHRFLIATPREDWLRIESLPITQKLRAFATPTLIETPPPAETSYEAILKHQTFSLKRLFEAAYADNAYGCAVWPDTILSDGFVAAMRRWVAAGHHVVMQPTVRLAEEDVLADLTIKGLLPEGRRLSSSGEALTVPPRVVADLSVRHLHPDLEVMVEGHPHQPLYPPYRLWRIPDRGLILHVFFATPVLMDFAAVPPNHADCLDSGDWETHYVGQNFTGGGLYVVADSDESGILSITPAAVRQAAVPARRFGAGLAPRVALLCNLRESVATYGCGPANAIRRQMFRVSVRWHAGDLDETWAREEQRITKLIDSAAGDYFANGCEALPRFSRDLRFLPLDLLNNRMRRRYATLLGILTGNRGGTARIGQKIRAIFSGRDHSR